MEPEVEPIEKPGRRRRGVGRSFGVADGAALDVRAVRCVERRSHGSH
jgi:hypothetical protein